MLMCPDLVLVLIESRHQSVFHADGSLCVSELKESLTRMGSDLKHGFISSLKSAWQTLNEFARAHTASAQLQAELAIVANQIEEQEKQAQEGESLRLLSSVGSFLCCVEVSKSVVVCLRA